MFRWLKKLNKTLSSSCTSCLYYGCVRSKDTLNPDKTITKGELKYEYCVKGKFYLTDHKPCGMYKELQEGDKRTARIMPPPPLKVRNR